MSTRVSRRRSLADDVSAVRVELVAVVVTVADGRPRVLASGDPLALPAGPLREGQASLQAGLREFVREQTGHRLGHVEQLYTFADAGRVVPAGSGERAVSISYLGLTREEAGTGWADVLGLLPWEDRRDGVEPAPDLLAALSDWSGADPAQREQRTARYEFTWGVGGGTWRPELALQRYELLWEAGLVAESPHRTSGGRAYGTAMLHDHRRIVATALSRVRATIQYRPVVFELLPETFTLSHLQDTVEALAGSRVHTQNFRRLVEKQHELVEATGELSPSTGGRPARLYRFAGSVHTERELVGTKLPRSR